jgi:hypothetical protein
VLVGQNCFIDGGLKLSPADDDDAAILPQQ